MNRRRYLWLSLLGLGVAALVAHFQTSPGYMDAEYYFLGGLRLAQGHGFTEPVLWNYLDDPAGLPHPSHAYWMPLASLLAYAGMALGGGETFATGRVWFLVLFAALPPLTAALTYALRPDRTAATLAGLLALLPGFYLPFLTTSDTFGLYMLLGGLFLLLAAPRGEGGRLAQLRWARALGLGALAGLMHLARADGLLWLVPAGIWVALQRQKGSARAAFLRPLAGLLALVLVGYLMITGPWMVRNLRQFGMPLSPGGTRALWLTTYDELFTYPPQALHFQHWWQAGVGTIVRDRLWALGQNLLSAFAVQGNIFLAPLIVAGAWVLRSDLRVRLGILGWGLILGGMTFLFPYPGVRGGFFHSGAAVQPLFWALAPAGLEVFLAWGARRRGWQRAQAASVFRIGLLTLALLLTAVLFRQRVLGPDPRVPLWGSDLRDYETLAQALPSWARDPQTPVLVNNPPGFYLASGQPAIVIPYGEQETLLAAARRYHACLLVLEANHPAPLGDLYTAPGDRPGLHHLANVNLASGGVVQVYRVASCGP